MFFHWIWHLTYINEWTHAKFQFWAPEINFWSKNLIFSPKNKLSAQHIWCLKFNWYIILCTLCIEMYELMHNNSPANFFSQKINFSPKSQFLAPKINFCPKNKFLIKKFSNNICHIYNMYFKGYLESKSTKFGWIWTNIVVVSAWVKQ